MLVEIEVIIGEILFGSQEYVVDWSKSWDVLFKKKLFLNRGRAVDINQPRKVRAR